MEVLSWNAGGLSLGLYDELLAWLKLKGQAGIRVVVIVETHWKHNSDWETDDWLCVHSGSSQESHAGVLIMVAKALTTRRMLRFQTIQQGRVLHVRFPLGPEADAVSLDVVGVYQFAWNTRKPRQALLQQRKEIWDALSGLVSKFSARNRTLVAGDLNVQLKSQSSQVGTAVLNSLGEDQAATDHALAGEVLRMCDLCALNTWRGPRSAAYTYSLGQAQSLIDHIMVRGVHADKLAKQCMPMVDFPIGAWRRDGNHRALLASIALPNGRHDWAGRAVAPRRRPALHVHLQKHPHLELALQQAFQAHVASMERCTAEGLNQCMMEACATLPVPGHDHGRPGHLAEATVQGPIAKLWSLWHAWRAARDGDPESAEKACKAHQAFKEQKQAVQRASRQARKDRVEGLLELAAQASRRGDTRAVYSVVKQLAPKTPRRSLQVRDEQGRLLSPSEEVAELRAHFRKVYEVGGEFRFFVGGIEPGLDGRSGTRIAEGTCWQSSTQVVCSSLGLEGMLGRRCATTVGSPETAVESASTRGSPMLEGWLDGADA